MRASGSSADSKAYSPSVAESAKGSNPTDVKVGEKYIIKTATLSVQARDIDGKLTEARKIVASHKGEVVYSTSRIKNQEVSSSAIRPGQGAAVYEPDYYPGSIVGDYALINLTVPVEDLDPLLTDLRKLGKVIVDTTSSQDATLDVLGLDAQITSTSKSLEGLEKLLTSAKSVDETLKVEQAITQRRAALASLKAQQSSLKQQASRSSVTLQIVTDKASKLTPAEQNWLQRTWEKISDSSSSVVALLVLAVLFFGPLFLVAMACRALWKAIFRKRKVTADEPYEKTRAASTSTINEEEMPDSLVKEEDPLKE